MDKLTSPPLLLSAPQIAGLLPAQVPSSRSASFTYTNPHLKALPAEDYDAILSSTFHMLDMMLSVAVGEVRPNVFLAAQHVLYELVVDGGPSRTFPTIDEMNARIAAHARTAKERLAQARADARQQVIDIERRYAESMRKEH